MLQQVVSSRWFALADLWLVTGSGLLWIFRPEIGILPIIAIALLTWISRLLAGSAPFKKTPFDWLVFIFFVMAWVGYWAAFDKETAWSKVWLIFLAVLLYYALSAQLQENIEWVYALVFCVGVSVSIYFLLTHDFAAFPRKIDLVNRIGHWIMGLIPRMGWAAIHPNYVAGITAITTPFILFPARKLIKRKSLLSTLILIASVVGSGIAIFSFFMATSRGAIFAVTCAIGIWIVWKSAHFIGSKFRVRHEAVFPALIFIYLFVMVLFLYAGPANSGGTFSESYFYGSGSRRELASRSAFLLLDYPVTGGGLGAFPGLYSHYMLGIPNFNVINSHNLFLDIAIEIGLLGGFAFLLMYLMSIWVLSHSLSQENSLPQKMPGWIVLFALIVAVIHGLVDDYLFSGGGTLLSLSLVACTALITKNVSLNKTVAIRFDRWTTGIALSLLVLALVLFSKTIMSAWYANWGAVQMSKVELDGFPDNGWLEPSILPQLDVAESAFQTALQFDPDNRTANQRLGMISMLRRDFELASTHLEKANQVAPAHRGIIKSLSYCLVWLGKFERAGVLLPRIPEAVEELDVYIWWWKTQGRNDLSENAAFALQAIRVDSNQP